MTEAFLSNYIAFSDREKQEYLDGLDQAIAHCPSKTAKASLKALRNHLRHSEKVVRPLIFTEGDLSGGKLPDRETVNHIIEEAMEIL